VCLRDVSPVRIRQKTERIAEAEAAVALLRHDPHDPVGRGLLGQAVDGVLAVPGLDSILLPMTAYDRLRFGGPTSRERWVDAPRAEFLTPTPPAWPLRTERLLLRPFEPRDSDAFIDAWADETYASLLLTRTMNASEVREMVRRRTEPGDGTFIGLVAEREGEVVADSILVLQGTGLSEGEIGWTVMPRHAGRGYATEAARAVLDWGFAAHGFAEILAVVHPGNDRSLRVCAKLGMTPRRDRLHPATGDRVRVLGVTGS
jgi:RimJ/RimL family protein N-acetyltransferase